MVGGGGWEVYGVRDGDSRFKQHLPETIIMSFCLLQNSYGVEKFTC